MGIWQTAKNMVKLVQLMKDGSYFYETWRGDTNYTDHDRLKTVLENPAALFLFTLLPDLFSMGKFKMYDKASGDEIEEHELLDFIQNPNFMQTESQFKWDYMFWRLLGTANLMINSKVLDEDNVMYFLSPDQMEWDKWFDENQQTIILTQEMWEEVLEKPLKYKTKSQELPLEYGQIKQFFDISNGTGSWFKGPSRVKALQKVIKNSDNALDSKNITSHLARKFWVSGKTDPGSTKGLAMGDEEKKSIEQSLMSKKNIHASRYMSDIKSFVSDAGVLENLDKAFMNDAFIIGKVLNIPKNVIELLGDDATHENQEKARAAIIGYCLQSPADDLAKGLLSYFELQDMYTLELDYSDLPFVQVFEKDKAEVLEKKSKAMVAMVSAGVQQEDAANELGWGFDTFNEPRNLSGNNNNNNSNQNGEEETD